MIPSYPRWKQGTIGDCAAAREHYDGGMRFWMLLARSLKLHCPVCGQGRLFRGWFSMHERCASCGVKYEREPGFFLGSIYINYGLTSLIVAVAYPILRFRYSLPSTPLMLASLAFILVFPVIFFRHSRSLWLGFDQWRDPQPGERSDHSQSPPAGS